jgi:hypothetical protein
MASLERCVVTLIQDIVLGTDNRSRSRAVHPEELKQIFTLDFLKSILPFKRELDLNDLKEIQRYVVTPLHTESSAS